MTGLRLRSFLCARVLPLHIPIAIPHEASTPGSPAPWQYRESVTDDPRSEVNASLSDEWQTECHLVCYGT